MFTSKMKSHVQYFIYPSADAIVDSMLMHMLFNFLFFLYFSVMYIDPEKST